jgi:hypothetical protein
MKKFLLVVLLAIIFIPSCKIDDEADIMEIYNKINTELPTYTHKTVDMVGISKDGGVITGYFKGKEIKKVTVESYFDTGRDYTEYYYADDDLVFVLQQKYHYNRPDYYTEERARANNDTEWYDDTRSTKRTSRFYFKDDEMIKWIDEKNFNRSEDSKDFEEQQKKIYADDKRIQQMMKEAQ